jgi:lycopene cyclase CruA
MSPREVVRDRVREMAGDELFERIEHLDAHVAQRQQQRPLAAQLDAPGADDAFDCDVLIAGGGLWSLLAPLLARRGVKVWIADRARVGAAHREWNASDGELAALVRSGLVTQAELDDLVVARYRHGFCRFGTGEDHVVTDVLDRAVDAGALLSHARRASGAAGVHILDGARVIGERASLHGVRVELEDRDGARAQVTCRILVDARGAASPYASADLVCPTVGGVLTGLAEGSARDEIDPSVGEILVTNEPIVDGRQHIWEAFPGKRGETTVYLFYYADAREPASLVELYARFFDTMPAYKRGDFKVARPTFGYIPGWSRLSPAPRTPSARVVLVGDAAARHSPLTFCGFGATLRSLELARDAITRALEAGTAPADPLVHDTALHAVTGAMARLMASRALQGEALNETVDAAFGAAAARGEDELRALLKDEMAPRTLIGVLRDVATRRGAVWGQALRGLGPTDMARVAVTLARTAASSPGRNSGRAVA